LKSEGIIDSAVGTQIEKYFEKGIYGVAGKDEN
jgi:hypothetical protein